MQKIHTVSVRTLAEFYCEHGDLISAEINARRMQEGIRGHQILQSMLSPGWQAELPVSLDVNVEGVAYRIQGRADAAMICDDCIRVQEIKTTSAHPSMILSDDHPEHWAQGEIYAWMLCVQHQLEHAEVTLTYARLDGARRDYHREYDWDTLREHIRLYTSAYALWIRETEIWQAKSEPTLKTLPFPFDTYRDGQREMAAQVYLSMKYAARALIEAPTGIGKTMASLFGALKALGEGYITSLFYLTARTTGRRAAEAAIDRMREKGLIIRSVTITAKEKCCLLQSKDCMGCPYSAGYYDRRRDAMHEVLNLEKLDQPALEKLAFKYELCPFELALDSSETADIVICDYNYVFDPRVHLKRFFDRKTKTGLLIDEAHNLPDRARAMLSAEMSGKKIRELCRLVKRFEGDQSPMYTELKRLYSAFRCDEAADMECLSALPSRQIDAVEMFNEAAQNLEPVEPEVVDFTYEAQWFAKAASMFSAESYRVLSVPENRNLSLRLWCFDPSAYIERLFKRTGGASLFSATITPLSFYARQLAVNEDKGDTLLRLESPFPSENLYVARLPVAVGFKDRERTRNAVCQVLHAMTEARPGNYIVCFPSYAYLMQIFAFYRMLFPDAYVIRQEQNMSESARLTFVESFKASPQRSMLAFIVLGGVFAEGIDLPDDRLLGAAIVTIGLQTPDFESEMLKERFDDMMDEGFDAAYIYPSLRKILQAAGRVIRSENDRGVVLLVDQRYRQEKFRELMPPHWRIHDISKMSVLNESLRKFWNE